MLRVRMGKVKMLENTGGFVSCMKNQTLKSHMFNIQHMHNIS